MTDGTDSAEDGRGAQRASTDASSDRPRVLTWRAIGIGGLLVTVLALITPWNDWFLNNTALYSHYLPPALILVLLAIGLAVNPLLGRYRLCRGEIAVVAIMVLALGGVVSSGLMRYLPTMMAMTPQKLQQGGILNRLKVPLTPAHIDGLRQRFMDQVATDHAAADRNGDSVLDHREATASGWVAEAVDQDGDGAVTIAELADYRRRLDPAAVPTWRWGLPQRLFLMVPATGPIPADDPEYRYIVEGYLEGLAARSDVRHRSQVQWRDRDGQVHRHEALAGAEAEQARRDRVDFLDLDHSTVGRALANLQPGDQALLNVGRTHTVATGDSWASIAEHHYGSAEASAWLQRANDATGQPVPETTLTVPAVLTVESVAPPPTPWYAWLGPALSWAPLLVGALVASLAVAMLVRQQWMDHERLPYPIAAVGLSLMDEPAPGHRFAPLFRNRLFWAAFITVAVIVTWHGLFRLGLLPIDFKLSFNFYHGDDAPFAGHPWNMAYAPQFLFFPRIHFSIIALTFFLALDVSFSLWFFFVAINLVYLMANANGIPLYKSEIQQAGVGGYAGMAVLILWMGRQYYGRLLKAAVIPPADPELRRTVPYVWALLGAVALMALALVSFGAPLGESLLLVVLFLGFMLVVSRIIAETGVPFIQVPNGWLLNSTLFSITGFSLPVTALMPLTLIGISLMADSRESLMPYAVNASYIGRKVGAPPKRLGGIMLAVVLLGAIMAGSSMIEMAYSGHGPEDRNYPPWLLEQQSLKMVAQGTAQHERATMDHQAADTLDHSQAQIYRSYGVGAALVGSLGIGRMFFSWWPLHPLGFLASVAYPTWLMWFSFFLGWLCKAVVMRYGGPSIYARLKPAAIGMIAAEAVVGGGFILAKIVAPDIPSYNILGQGGAPPATQGCHCKAPLRISATCATGTPCLDGSEAHGKHGGRDTGLRNSKPIVAITGSRGIYLDPIPIYRHRPTIMSSHMPRPEHPFSWL